MKLSDARRARLDGLNWYALRVESRKEVAAAYQLKLQGFTVFLPMTWCEGRASKRCGKRMEMTRLVLVRYVLIGFAGDPPWHEVRRFSMIEGVVAINGVASRIAPKDLARLFAGHPYESLTPNNVRFRQPVRQLLKRNNVVETTDGLLSGQPLRIENLKGNRAEVVLLDDLAARSVSVDVDKLQLIE